MGGGGDTCEGNGGPQGRKMRRERRRHREGEGFGRGGRRIWEGREKDLGGEGKEKEFEATVCWVDVAWDYALIPEAG